MHLSKSYLWDILCIAGNTVYLMCASSSVSQMNNWLSAIFYSFNLTYL